MDENVPRAVTLGLRQRGVDVLTAQEDGYASTPDAQILDRAGELGRVLFSQDDDLLVEANRRQAENLPFSGVVYAHQLKITTGLCVRDLEFLARAADSSDMENRVEFLLL